MGILVSRMDFDQPVGSNQAGTMGFGPMDGGRVRKHGALPTFPWTTTRMCCRCGGNVASALVGASPHTGFSMSNRVFGAFRQWVASEFGHGGAH